MYCEECKERVASVHLTKIVNGNKIQKHLCEECAKKYQEELGMVFKPQFTFSNFLGSLLENEVFPQFDNVSLKDSKCDKCGMTYSEFLHGGRMGCNKCFSYFGDRLKPLLKRIHGTTTHTGKIPERIGGDLKLQNEIKEAKLSLKEAVSKEKFEEAAVLRDKIKELEKNFKNEE